MDHTYGRPFVKSDLQLYCSIVLYCTTSIAPVAELRDAWHSVAALSGGEDKLAMCLGEKVACFADIASASGDTQKAISTALHTQMYQSMSDVDGVGQPGGAPSREAAVRLMSSSGERGDLRFGRRWLRFLATTSLVK